MSNTEFTLYWGRGGVARGSTARHGTARHGTARHGTVLARTRLHCTIFYRAKSIVKGGDFVTWENKMATT